MDPLRAAIVALALSSSGAAADCNIAPPPSGPLRVDGFHRDREGRVVDPVRLAARARAVEIYEATIRKVQDSADAFALRTDRDAARCALLQLDAWAQAAVLTGRLDRQANYERNWYLAGFAFAYLKVRDAAEEGRRSRIESWLGTMAEGSVGALDAGEVPGNNLLYWSGLALGAAGLATRSNALLDRAQRILVEGLAAVSPDGMLRAETSRGRKALDYHVFAAAPLVLLAFLSEERGQAFDRAALKRLGDGILSGLANPERFAAAAGEPQEVPAAWNLAWLPVYRLLLPGGATPPHASASHFLGGDVRATVGAIRAAMRQ